MTAREIRQNGGKARAKALTPEQRIQIARRAGEAYAASLTTEQHRTRMAKLLRLRWKRFRERNKASEAK
jgi:hypothetical protein